MITKAARKPWTVLLVEDNLSDAELALHSLDKLHEAIFFVEHVEQLDAAIARLALGGIDVALIDLSLPDSIGMRTYQAIRAAAPSVPVVVLTGLDDEETVIDLLHQGAQDYLLKHEVEPKLLARSLRFAIERQRTVELELCIQQLAAARTLLERKNARLRKLYRTAQEFVDSVSHEFRTPLTVIKEYTSLVMDGVVGEVSDEQKHMLAVVEDRAEDLNTMVDDMLDVSKLEAGLLTINRRDCQVAEILALVRPCERKAAIKGVRLEFEIDPRMPAAFCDPDKVARVLNNLTTNAIKFCGQPGSVRVNCLMDSEPTGIKISVSDNGNGIGAENLQAIFRRFKQLGHSVRSSTKGFGLGLNIAKELVELNLGQLSVESQVGHGTTFSFTLPSADPSEVLRRFLKRLEHHRSASTHLSLVQVEGLESASASLADDAHALLSHVVYSSDLLFRIGPVQWLVVLLIAEKEIGTFRERFDQAINTANRNRRGDPLPDMRLKVLGTWNVISEQDEILKCLSDAIEPVEAVYS